MPTNLHATIIYNAFSQGLDSEQIVAYHGTSLQTLKTIIETGKQSSDNLVELSQIPQHYRLGDVCMYPINGKATLPFVINLLEEEQALEGAGIYAEVAAREHTLAEKLGLDPFKARYELFGNYIEEAGDDYIDCSISTVNNVAFFSYLAYKATGRKYERTEILQLMKELEQVQGVVLGYSQQALDRGDPLPITEGGDEDSGVRLVNVSIDSIMGIEVLDQVSWDFLNSLGKA